MIDTREYLHLALIETKPDQTICYANPSAETLMESSRERLYQQKLAHCLQLKSHPWDTLINNSNNPIIIRSGELHLLKPKTQIKVDLAVHHLPNQHHLISIDPISRAIAIARTEERQRQAEHNRLIIKNLAHEIRNPLAGIKGAAQRLLSQSQNGQKTYIDLIINQVERLNQLLTTMNGEGKPKPAPHNIHRIIEETLHLFQADPKHQNIHIKRQYDPTLPDIEIDAHQIQQVLINLLSNAAKASAHQGEIIISTLIRHQYTLKGQQHRQVLALSIEDHGFGIAEEMQIAIFQPMISQFSEGSGLGLSIVQHIIHQHGGTIELESQTGKTTFTLILPYKRTTP